MARISETQYKDNLYPLKRYNFADIPAYIWELLSRNVEKPGSAIRGGLAYILLTNDTNYILKDIDLICKRAEFEKEIRLLSSSADEIYINRNTFGDRVISAFWKEEYEEYYKIDVLITDTMPDLCEIRREGHIFRVIDITALWVDRIKKICQKKIRNHTDEKTRRHIYVAQRLTKRIMQIDRRINNLKEMQDIIWGALRVAENCMEGKDYNKFREDIEGFIKRQG